MKPFSTLLLAVPLTTCTPSPEAAYKKAIQEALDRHWASCQLQPKPWCVSVGPVKVTRVYGVESDDNAIPGKYSEAVVVQFDAVTDSGQKDDGNVSIGNESGHWTV